MSSIPFFVKIHIQKTYIAILKNRNYTNQSVANFSPDQIPGEFFYIVSN